MLFFNLKKHLNVFGSRAQPGPAEVAYSALQDRLAGLRGMGALNPLPHGDANRHTIFKRKN